MSVYMSLRIDADPAKFEEVATRHKDTMLAIAERAKAQGCIHHRFAAQDGQIVAIDEWESPEAFQRFFESEQDIPKLFEEVGVTGQPQPEFFRPIDVGDSF